MGRQPVTPVHATAKRGATTASARRLLLGVLIVGSTACGGVDRTDLTGVSAGSGGSHPAQTDGGGGVAVGSGGYETAAGGNDAVGAHGGVCGAGCSFGSGGTGAGGFGGGQAGGATSTAGASSGAGGAADTGGAIGAGGATASGGTTGAGGGGSSTCPATMPSSGAGCLNFNLSCKYGSTTCACLLILALPVWACK